MALSYCIKIFYTTFHLNSLFEKNIYICNEKFEPLMTEKVVIIDYTFRTKTLAKKGIISGSNK